MTTFDKAAYNDILDDIETYLGYLKGNELVFEYLESARKKFQATGRQCVTQKNYTTPCSDPAFTYKPLYHLPLLEDGSMPDGLEPKLFAGADASWRKGPTWASGIAGQARAITEQITSPDVAELDAAVTTLKDEVLRPLELLVDSNADLPGPYRIPLPDGDNSLSGDWANLDGLLNTWHGNAADEFRTLYNKLESCIGMYAYFAGAAALEVAAASHIIASSQQGLLISVKDIRKTLSAQLKEWQETDLPPKDDEVSVLMVLIELLPATKIYKGARLIIDNVRDPKQIISVLGDIKTSLVGKSGKHAATGEKEPFQAANSEEVLKSLTTMLRQTYLDGFTDVMTDLSPSPSGSSLDLLHTVREQGQWASPSVSEGSVRGHGDSYPA